MQTYADRTLWTYRETEGHTSRNRNGKPEDPDAFRTGSCSKRRSYRRCKANGRCCPICGTGFSVRIPQQRDLRVSEGTSGVYKGCSCTFRGCGILQRSEETCGTSRTGDRNDLWDLFCGLFYVKDRSVLGRCKDRQRTWQSLQPHFLDPHEPQGFFNPRNG